MYYFRVSCVICTLTFSGLARAENFDANCKPSLAETLRKRDKENVGVMWRPDSLNWYPSDYGYLVGLLQMCRHHGFSEGRRWREMVRLSNNWIIPPWAMGSDSYSEAGLFETARKGFGNYAKLRPDPVCECITGMEFFGPYGSDLSETLRFKAP